MKLYSGLLALGLVMVGGGLWFAFKPSTVGTHEIAITPSPSNYLANSQNVSSQVLLKDIQVKIGVSDKQYEYPYYYAGESTWYQHTINAGDSILLFSGNIQNKHKENKEVAMYAEGYDADGKQVAWQ